MYVCMYVYVLWVHTSLSCKQHLVQSSGVDRFNVWHHAKCHEDQSKHYQHMAIFRFWAGSPSNTVLPGPRPTSMPSFILIHPTFWPQYTNVTDRTGQDTQTWQTDRTERQWSDSIGRTVLQTATQKDYSSWDNSIQLSNQTCLVIYMLVIWQLT